MRARDGRFVPCPTATPRPTRRASPPSRAPPTPPRSRPPGPRGVPRRPGGHVAFVWKYPTPETRYTYLVEEIATRLTGSSLLAGAVFGIGTVPQLLRAGFDDYTRVTFEQPIAYTVERYVGYVSSRERV